MKAFLMRRILTGLVILVLLGCRQCTDDRGSAYHQKPFVTEVGIISGDLIFVAIQAGEMKPSQLVNYMEMPGDSVVEKRNPNDEVIERMLYREGKPVGWIIGKEQELLRVGQQFMGAPLEVEFADDPLNYQVIPGTDGTPGSGFTPVEVFRKSKPNNWLEPSREFCIEHRIYLKLPEPMVPGTEYTIQLGRLNTETSQEKLLFDPEETVNEAIHVSHIGLRPGDPGKRAYLSAWLGTGGAVEFENGMPFHLVDRQTGEKVFSGVVRLAFGAGQEERMKYPKSFSKTHVYHMDFGSFDREGEYVVQVEGVGVSRPFPISDKVWLGAMRTAMKGFVSHPRQHTARSTPHFICKTGGVPARGACHGL